MIRLSIGQRQPARPAPSNARRRLLVVASVLVASLASGADPAPDEGLVMERRFGRVRDLAECGTRKACLRKQLASHADGARLAAAAAPTMRHSRWSRDQYDDVRVWIAPGTGIKRWREENRWQVRDAFHAWTAAEAPVRFVFVADSARADVHVVWRTQLPGGRAGQVTRLVERGGWLRGAVIELSTRNMRGGVQKPSTVGAVALHEVGHLLGLEHSPDEGDIMAAWVTATELSVRDRRAMRALYDVAESDADALAEWGVVGGDLSLAERERE